MAFKFFDWLRPKNGKTASVEVSCDELFNAAQEFQVRLVALNVCVNMIASTIGRCEFKTFENGSERKGAEYYLWNFEPNINQNSTAFLHKLIYKLCTENEALVINTAKTRGHEDLVVADNWISDKDVPDEENIYTGVAVGDKSFDMPFKESDVLHFKLNNENISRVTEALFKSYCRLVSAAVKSYEWGSGQHWKVHVSQLASGGEGWVEDFQKMIEAQLKPFFDSNGAILPEFDGYDYKDVGSETKSSGVQDIKTLIDDVFEVTARALQIPAVLVKGQIEGTSDANNRFLTYCIDPICDQLQEEITRKRYGLKKWMKGEYLRIDSSSIIHFDLFANATAVEKLVGSGAFSINDIRAAAGQTPINEPWANAYYMTKNIANLDAQVEAVTKKEGGE